MYFIGIDPDTHATGIAVLSDATIQPVCFVGCCKAKGSTGGEAVIDMAAELQNFFDVNIEDSFGFVAAAIEAQEISYTSRQGKNPRNLVTLAAVAGACLSNALKHLLTPYCYFPLPQRWKGSVPKTVHQARVLGRIGWKSEIVGDRDIGYARPVSVPGDMELVNVGKTDWKHVVDAIGLALWCREQYLKDSALDRHILNRQS